MTAERDRLAHVIHEAHGDWYNGHRHDGLALADRLIAAGVRFTDNSIPVMTDTPDIDVAYREDAG